jgi:hypothetical protein
MLQKQIGMLRMLQWLYTYVASVYLKCFIYLFRRMFQACLFGYCICFAHMLQVFYLDVKCFICLQKYVANVSSGYFKSRSGVTHVAKTLMAGGQRPCVGLRLLPRTACLALSPLLSLPFLPSPLSRRGSSSSARKPYPTSTWTPTEALAPGGLMVARCPCGGPGVS